MGKYTDKKVLMRVEFNVPLSKTGKILDDTRIVRAIPTIKSVLSQKPKQLLLMFHLGRPKGREKILQTDKVAEKLSVLLKRSVDKVDHCGEEDVVSKSKVVVLENLRFYEGEKKGDLKFAKQLASLADVYVNESFGTSHRKDASMYVVPKLFSKSNRFLGPLVKEEVKKLSLVNNSKDLVAVVGFAKIEDKIHLLEKMLRKSKRLLVGGLVVYTFMKAQGLSVGAVKTSPAEVKSAKKLLDKFGKKIILSVDFRGRDSSGKLLTVPFDEVPKDFVGFDVGPKTVMLFCEVLKYSKVVFWNGPLGYFEKKPFDLATNKLSKFLNENSSGIKTIVGGGDTASAIKLSGHSDKIYHISTGGGASLALIDKGSLPALKWFK